MALPKIRIVPSAEPKEEQRSPGVLSRGLAFSDKVMMFETHIKAGSERPVHAHPHDQVGYVVKGEMELIVTGNQPYACKVGDSFSVPGGVQHSIRAIKDTVIVDAFNQVPQPPKDGSAD